MKRRIMRASKEMTVSKKRKIKVKTKKTRPIKQMKRKRMIVKKTKKMKSQRFLREKRKAKPK